MSELYASKFISVVKQEIGYYEKASNKNLDDKTANKGSKNYTKYSRDFDTIYLNFYNGKKQGAEWCDIFYDWCMVKTFGIEEAKKLLCQPAKSLGAGCKYSANYYKNNKQFYTSNPQVGDQIFFKSSTTSTSPCHTGAVVGVDGVYVYTVEGNMGNCVSEHKYKLTHNLIFGYGRPKFDAEPIQPIIPTPQPVPAPTPSKKNPLVERWQKAAIADGFKQPKYFIKYGADGEWGAECEAVAKVAIVKYRLLGYKYKNLTKLVQELLIEKGFLAAKNSKGKTNADGLCGSATKAAIKKWQATVFSNKKDIDGEMGLNSYKKILGI